MKMCELTLILTAALVPIFILANEVSGDEFAKAATGVLLAGTTIAVTNIYKTWKSNNANN